LPQEVGTTSANEPPLAAQAYTPPTARLSTVDAVYQGDLHSVKGVSYINTVNEKVTQFEIVVYVEKISEAYLQRALHGLLIHKYPVINPSSFLNKKKKGECVLWSTN
jgi:hypothetical protein